MPTNALAVTYRDVGLSLCAVDSELQWCVPVEEGKEALGPEGGNEIFMLEPPVEVEHSVEVQSQTAAVVHQHTQLLSLESKQKQINISVEVANINVTFAITLNIILIITF